MSTSFSLTSKPFAHTCCVLACLFALLGDSYTLRAQSFVPDLSNLSSEEKKEGKGQFQKKSKEEEDREKEEKKERERREERERHRREHERWQQFHSPRVVAPVVVGGAVGAAALGSTALRDPTGTDPISIGPTTIYEHQSEETYEVPLEAFESSPIARPLRFRDRFQISMDGNALVFYDMSGSSTPITQGIQASRVRLKEATGFDASFGFKPRRNGETGFVVRGMAIEGSSSASVSTANLLFTTPNIGFAGNPVQVTRDSSLFGVEGNWLFGDIATQSHFGIRVHHFEDNLLTRVLPSGVLHQVDTKSTSVMAQLGINPRKEWDYLHWESMFQVGAGLVAGESETRLQGVVGPISDYYLEADKIKIALLFHGRLGVAVPVTKYGRLRTGLQLLAHNNMAIASGQIPVTNFTNSQSRLRTNTLALGGVYAGLELNW
jgi:hypothetical protein